ncbi:MAG: carboxypeptidase regulatory-like domain-containing protein [Acidobacteriota bacterium]|nr:carboxypeptidase regulatory-like domain-containing protein [Acidobacteriota bacterium]
MGRFRASISTVVNSCVLVPLCLLMLSSSHAQQIQPNSSTGLQVTVIDPDQHFLRGVTCSLFRPTAPPKVVATAVTNDQGVAIFASLTPGLYTLRVEVSGFEPFKGDVVIEDKSSSEIRVALPLASVAESVTVESPNEEATGVEAGASTASGSLQRKLLQRLPLVTARIDEALPLIPGVVRSSTGEISIKGANEQQSALLVNGLNVDDPSNGNFRLNLPVDSVEAVQVFQHPYTAEYGHFTGGVTKIETRRGGDHWHWELNDFIPDLRFKGGKIVGIAEDLPRLNFNGPLIENRLFFSQALSYAIAKNPVRGLTFPANETKNEAQSYFSQFDLLLSKRHTVAFTFGYFPERNQFVGLDLFRPQPVTPNYKQRDFVTAVRDNYELSGGLLQSSVSYKRFNANVWGQGPLDQTLTPTFEEGNYFATQNRRSRRTEILEVYQLPTQRFLTGSHEIKTGFDFNSVTSRLNYAARPVNIVRADGTLAERVVFHRMPVIIANNREFVGFGQDRWLVRPNLSFDFGVRYENQRIASEQNLAPRGGFAWSPFAGDRTVIRGGVGLFFDKVPLNIRSFNRYPSRTITRYAPDGVTVIDSRRFTNVLVETAPIAPLDFRISNNEAGFVPKNLTWNVQLDHAVASWMSIRANLIGSRTNNIYIVNPELDYRGQSAIVLRSAGRATYRALELTARFVLPEKNTFYVSYVRSHARGDLNDFNSYFGDFGQPVIRQNQFSNLPFNVPDRLIAWGTLALPHRITISSIIEARSGFPFSVRDTEQNFVGVRNAGNQRFPRFFAVDVELSKDFQVTRKYALRLSVQGFNLTNHFNPRNVRSNIADPHFGEFSSSYNRYFSGGFDILF